MPYRDTTLNFKLYVEEFKLHNRFCRQLTSCIPLVVRHCSLQTCGPISLVLAPIVNRNLFHLISHYLPVDFLHNPMFPPINLLFLIYSMQNPNASSIPYVVAMEPSDCTRCQT